MARSRAVSSTMEPVSRLCALQESWKPTCRAASRPELHPRPDGLRCMTSPASSSRRAARDTPALRNEGVTCTYIYTQTGILTHGLLDLVRSLAILFCHSGRKSDRRVRARSELAGLARRT